MLQMDIYMHTNQFLYTNEWKNIETLLLLTIDINFKHSVTLHKYIPFFSIESHLNE